MEKSTDPSIVEHPPLTWRLFCFACASITFGCISNNGWNDDICVFNKDEKACRLGYMNSLESLIGTLNLLVLDCILRRVAFIRVHKMVSIVDFVFSMVFAILSTYTFSYLVVAWKKSESIDLEEGDFYSMFYGRTAIAFSFLSIPAWAGCAYHAFKRLRSWYHFPHEILKEPPILRDLFS